MWRNLITAVIESHQTLSNNYIPRSIFVYKGTVFKSNISQAVRLPVAMTLPDSVTRVDIIPVGNGRLFVPAGEG